MTAEPILQPMVNDKREIFGWAMYDWANSAFSTTVGTVFLGPYLASLAALAAKDNSDGLVRLAGVPIAPDSFLPYCVSISVGLQVLFLPILGAIADYSHMRKRMLQIFATIGALATILMFFVTGGLWWLGGVLFITANLAFGAAMVFYNAYLPDIASVEERDRVSSYGWAMGYLGGGLLLALNLAFYTSFSNYQSDGYKYNSGGNGYSGFFHCFVSKDFSKIEIIFYRSDTPLSRNK